MRPSTRVHINKVKTIASDHWPSCGGGLGDTWVDRETVICGAGALTSVTCPELGSRK